jgi:hypothetical protein
MSRAMWKTAAWLAQTIEHLVRVLLVKTRRSQLGDCNAVGSRPAGKRARFKDQLQRQKKGGDLVRSFLPTTRRTGLNEEQGRLASPRWPLADVQALVKRAERARWR